MKKRSLLALAMVGALSVSMLAGCGSSSTKETQAPAGSEAATEAATEAETGQRQNCHRLQPNPCAASGIRQSGMAGTSLPCCCCTF